MAKIEVLVSVTYESIEDLTFHIMPFTWVPIPLIFMTSFVSTHNQSCSEETMASLSRFEISGPELGEANKKAAILFKKIGWVQFFRCFSGHNVEVTKQFAMSFKKNVAQIRDFKFIIDEDKIAEATKFPQTGERWFKGEKVDKKKGQSLLFPLPANSKLKIGVSVKFLKP